jgi:hypothetical protein
MIPRIAKALKIEPADLFREPDDLISLDAAAAHITDNEIRTALVTIIKGYHLSRAVVEPRLPNALLTIDDMLC